MKEGNTVKKKSMWSLKLNTATLVLIPAAIAINYVGKLIAETLKLPLWLDAIGTILSAFLGGPIVGAISGGVTNLIYGLTSPISLVYALTSVGIGIAAGIMAAAVKKKDFKFALFTGIVCGVVAIIISTPLNIIFWEGTTGNAIGDTAFAWAIANGWPLVLASLLNEVIIDVPDKIVTTLIVYGIYKAIPAKTLILFNNAEEIERLD